MKITKSQLKQIIKEELESVLNEGRPGLDMWLNAYENDPRYTGPDVDSWQAGRSTRRADKHIDTSADIDRAYDERSFGPEDVKETAVELAAEAGLYGDDDYVGFLKKAKEYIARHGKGYKWTGN